MEKVFRSLLGEQLFCVFVMSKLYFLKLVGLNMSSLAMNDK